MVSRAGRAIDGKTLRRIVDNGSGKAALRLVSAWATANRMSLGRDETREDYVCAVPRDFKHRRRWPGLAALGCVVSRVQSNGKTTTQRRHDILSRNLTAKEFAGAVRGPWSIENQLHWQLDVSFGEDQSRIRLGHADGVVRRK